MIKNYNILYSLPFTINNGLITALNSMQGAHARFFSSTSLPVDNQTKLISFLFKDDLVYLEFTLADILEPYYKAENTFTHVRFSLNYKSESVELFNDIINNNISTYYKDINSLVNKIYWDVVNWRDEKRLDDENMINNIYISLDIRVITEFNRFTTKGNKILNPSGVTGKRKFSSIATNDQKVKSVAPYKEPINIISITKANTKVKTSKLWIDFSLFSHGDLKKFSNELFYSGKITPNTDYSLLIKLRKNDLFFTIAERQEYFIFKSLNDNSFQKLFYFITDKLYDIFEEYKFELEYSCDSILLEFRPINIEEKLKISDLDKVKLEYPNIDTKIITKDLGFYGKSFDEFPGSSINFKIIDGKLQIFNLDDIDNLDKFLDEFNSKISTNESSDYFINDFTKLYLIYRLNRPFIIIINIFEDGKNIIKRSFNIYGDLISKIEDINNFNDTFSRKNRNNTTIIKGNNIISSIRNIKFNPIKNEYKSTKVSSKDWLPNSNIGTLDLETYEINGVAKCYAIGFYCNEFKECNTYYIDEDLDSTKIIHKCLTEMLKPKHNKNLFYVHNLGKFDSVFLIKALIHFNKTSEGVNNPYLYEVETRNSDILKLIIKRKNNNRMTSIVLKDSAAILPSTLRDLCKNFQVNTEKGFFPYNFCTKDTLFYVGKTPSINYYNNITQEEYNSLYKEVWSLKNECLLYLNKDLISLCEVLVKVNKILHLKYNIQMTESLTISSLAIKIFLKDHYDPIKKPIPLVTNRLIWNNIYKAYYGGRVEVYNPFFKQDNKNKVYNKFTKKYETKVEKTLYYYDVNSLYPSASLNLMPGLECEYIESYTSDSNKLDLNNLFGFFYCKIKSSSEYIGLLPKRSEGRLTFPNGEWYDWYFTPELLFPQERGYKIEVIKGYKFNSIKDVFTSFVYTLIEMKINASNPSERNVAKLILNSLIGRFGMDFLKSVTKLLDSKNHDLVSVTRVLKNSIEMDEDLFLDTFKTSIDKEICEDFGVDYIKALNIESISEKSSTRSYNTVSIPIAAATLSYARIHMNKIIMHILDNGGKIYYTDTDSIVTDLKLSEDFVHPSELGKLKLEHEIEEGYFITDKTYAFINTKGKLVKKAKGVQSEFLTFDDYKKMYQLKHVVDATKTTSKRDYAKGSVVIKTKNDINLNIEHYIKRTRIFKNNKWIGTTPLYVHELDNTSDSYNDK